MKRNTRTNEPLRLFRYSLDGGATWLLCLSTVRGDDVRQVWLDLSARYALPVMVREKTPRLASKAARRRRSPANDGGQG